MSKLIAVLMASLFATAAFAQQNVPGQPPMQPPAGNAVDMKKDANAMTPTSDKKAARQARSKARHAKREAKVGPKPIN